MKSNKQVIKIGVITFYRDNYGAFLQAYALQRALFKLGYYPELINYNDYFDNAILGIPLALIVENPKLFFKRLVVEVLLYLPHKEKRKVFRDCISKYLIESSAVYKTSKDLYKNPPKYDIYLSGSDQVFNPSLQSQSFSSRLLSFTKGCKVTYAASVGNIDNIIKKEGFVNQLSEFKKLSVREDELRDYILSKGLEVKTHIDPTFLLSFEDWSKIAIKPADIKTPYIFYYRVLPQEKLEVEASKISEILNLPIYTGDGRTKFKNQIKRNRTLTPMEWVGALLNAEYVVTNSFHGCAFSINLRKKALIVLPPKGKDRILNIINKTKTERLINREIISDIELKDIYKHSENYVCNERLEATNYLDSFRNLVM